MVDTLGKRISSASSCNQDVLLLERMASIRALFRRSKIESTIHVLRPWENSPSMLGEVIACVSDEDTIHDDYKIFQHVASDV